MSENKFYFAALAQKWRRILDSRVNGMFPVNQFAELLRSVERDSETILSALDLASKPRITVEMLGKLSVRDFNNDKFMISQQCERDMARRELVAFLNGEKDL